MDEQIRILCVDDEGMMLSSLRRFFLDEDYVILTASSAEEGLALIQANAPVHVILSDYRMPSENGLEFLRKVSVEWPDTVGIIFSGYADLSVINNAIDQNEIFMFIPKPWDVEQMKKAMTEALLHYDARKGRQEP